MFTPEKLQRDPIGEGKSSSKHHFLKVTRDPKGKSVVFQLLFLRGELLNFRGVFFLGPIRRIHDVVEMECMTSLIEWVVEEV